MNLDLPNWVIAVVAVVVVGILAIVGWTVLGPQQGLTAEEQRREEIMIQRSDEAAQMKITGQQQMAPGSEAEARWKAQQQAQGQ